MEKKSVSCSLRKQQTGAGMGGVLLGNGRTVGPLAKTGVYRESN